MKRQSFFWTALVLGQSVPEEYLNSDSVCVIDTVFRILHLIWGNVYGGTTCLKIKFVLGQQFFYFDNVYE